MAISTPGQRPKLTLTSIICGILLLASSVTLALALSTDIVVSRFVEIGELVQTLYPEGDYLADNPDNTAEDYQEFLRIIEDGTDVVLGLSGRAQKIYTDLTTPTGYTVGAGAIQLWDAGDKAPAVLIIVFSILMPILKTLLMIYAYLEPYIIKGASRAAGVLKLLNLSHKYTMLDVFVVSVTVFAFSKNALVAIEPAEALLWYIGYMAVSYAALGILGNGNNELKA